MSLLLAVGGAQTFFYTASGGITFSGASTVARVFPYAATGGIVFAGAAAYSLVAALPPPVIAIGGGRRRRGPPPIPFRFPEPPKPSIEPARFAYLASGGLVFGGAAIVSHRRTIASQFVLTDEQVAHALLALV